MWRTDLRTDRHSKSATLMQFSVIMLWVILFTVVHKLHGEPSIQETLSTNDSPHWKSQVSISNSPPPPIFRGTYCELAPDPCASVNCFNGGYCVAGRCTCINDFQGDNCETPPDPCRNIVCFNNGICNNGVCNCVNGFRGTYCRVAPDPCLNVNCLNGGNCRNGNCECVNGFSGTNCETPPDPCLNINCGINGVSLRWWWFSYGGNLSQLDRNQAGMVRRKLPNFGNKWVKWSS